MENKKWVDFVALYHTDEEFARKVDANPAEMLREKGFDVPEGVEVKLHKNTPELVNVVVDAKSQEMSARDLAGISAASSPVPPLYSDDSTPSMTISTTN